MDKQDNSSDYHRSYLEAVAEAGGISGVSSIESLSGAMKIGFQILRILMVVLAVVFLFSNIYWVPEGYVAFQSRLGKFVGEGAGAVRRPGGPYLAFPYPVDTIVRVPTTIQKLTLYNAFWSETETLEPLFDDRPESESLRPGDDGFLMTADKNLVQGIWIIHYKPDFNAGDPTAASGVTRFVENIGTMVHAEKMIRQTAQSAIVRVVSGTKVSDFIAGNIDNESIRRMMENSMKNLKTGLTITNVSAGRYAVPRALTETFEAVSQAESQKALDIEKASRRRVSTLNELVGREWRVLLDAIDAYEKTLHQDDQAASAAACEKARNVISHSEVGGAVKQMLDEARSEKSAEVQRTRTMVARFRELLPAYEKNGSVFESQLLQDTIKEIWSDISVDAVYVPEGRRIYLDLAREKMN